MGRGTNLCHAFGYVPPSVATAPSSAFSRNSVRATCQPPRLPDAALRQLWDDSRVPADATTSASSAIVAASTPDSAAAKSNVYSSYSSARRRSKRAKSASEGSSETETEAETETAPLLTFVSVSVSVSEKSMNSRQFHHRRTNSRLYKPFTMICRAIASRMAASEPGYGATQ